MHCFATCSLSISIAIASLGVNLNGNSDRRALIAAEVRVSGITPRSRAAAIAPLLDGNGDIFRSEVVMMGVVIVLTEVDCSAVVAGVHVAVFFPARGVGVVAQTLDDDVDVGDGDCVWAGSVAEAWVGEDRCGKSGEGGEEESLGAEHFCS